MDRHKASQLIPALDAAPLMREAQAYLDKRLKFNPDRKPSWQWRDADVYEFGDGSSNSYIFLVENGKVTYFVRYQRVRYAGLALGRQVLVLRNEMTPATAGFAQHVFFSKLLPKYGMLIADKQQTEFGKNFWLNATDRAFGVGLHVYFLDRRSAPHLLKKLDSDADIHQLRNEIWGTSKEFQNTFLIISQKPLVLKPRH